MASWDPRTVDKAIYLQSLITDAQKVQFKTNPPVVKPEITNPVQPVVEAIDAPSIRRAFERSIDPPATVIKFINDKTNELEKQIPSAVSLKIYKQMLEFIEKNPYP